MKKLISIAMVSTLFLMCVQVQAAVSYVKDIQLLAGSSTWYDGSSGTFQIDETDILSRMAIINVWEDSALYRYGIIDATVSVSESSLVFDNSAGQVADGTFSSGSELVIDGTIVLINTGGSTTDLFTGNLITASMTANDWDLSELSFISNLVTGAQTFKVTSGELKTGDNCGLVMNFFQTLFSFNFNTSEITDFAADKTYESILTQIQISAPSDGVPEPATVALLLAGGLMLSRAKR